MKFLLLLLWFLLLFESHLNKKALRDELNKKKFFSRVVALFMKQFFINYTFSSPSSVAEKLSYNIDNNFRNNCLLSREKSFLFLSPPNLLPHAMQERERERERERNQKYCFVYNCFAQQIFFLLL
jgi:hypothetical protein